MDIEVNYRNKRRYKTAKYPLHQTRFWTWLIWFLSKIMLIGKTFKVEKVGMEGLKPPYMILSNHMHFIDFELAAMATWPHPVSNVVSIDGYVIKGFLLEWIGAIATRKYTTDPLRHHRFPARFPGQAGPHEQGARGGGGPSRQPSLCSLLGL